MEMCSLSRGVGPGTGAPDEVRSWQNRTVELSVCTYSYDKLGYSPLVDDVLPPCDESTIFVPAERVLHAWTSSSKGMKALRMIQSFLRHFLAAGD